jgi:hypothetical protein
MKELEKLVAFVRPFVAMEIELCKNYLFAFWLMGSTTRCCKAKNHRCSLFPALRISIVCCWVFQISIIICPYSYFIWF